MPQKQKILDRLVLGIEGINFCVDRHLQEGSYKECCQEIRSRVSELFAYMERYKIPTAEDFPTIRRYTPAPDLDSFDKIKTNRILQLISRGETWKEKVMGLLNDPRTSVSSILEIHLKPLFDELNKFPFHTRLLYLKDLQKSINSLSTKNLLWKIDNKSIDVLNKHISASLREIPVQHLMISEET